MALFQAFLRGPVVIIEEHVLERIPYQKVGVCFYHSGRLRLCQGSFSRLALFDWLSLTLLIKASFEGLFYDSF